MNASPRTFQNREFYFASEGILLDGVAVLGNCGHAIASDSAEARKLREQFGSRVSVLACMREHNDYSQNFCSPEDLGDQMIFKRGYSDEHLRYKVVSDRDGICILQFMEHTFVKPTNTSGDPA